jgi:Glycosyltransferase Family 4
VATIPFADPYVDAVLPPDVVRVGPSGELSPWLDVAYLEAHAAEIDVLHLHTGQAHVAAVAVQCWTETVRRLGIPLVVTVHRLGAAADAGACPRDTQMDAHLEAVLSTAEVVLTLTRGAADEIAERFGRTAIVVAHPSVAVPDPELGAERGLVGLRLGRISAATPDPGALVRAALSGAVSGGGRLRVLVGAADEPWVGSAVRKLVAAGDVELVVHPAEQWPAQLQQLHVAVLPEPCGSHSRDLETCRDVGTRVVTPTCGWFADQWSDVVSYGNHEQGRLDPVSLTAAIGAALARPMPRPADRDWREEQRAAVRRVHADVYAQVAADRSWV